MRHLTPLVICLACLLSGSLLAQDAPIKYGDIPQEDLAMEVYAADTSANVVVLCHYGKTTFEMTESGHRTRLYRHKRIKFLRRSGFDYGNISILYLEGHSILKDFKARIVAPDGTETKLPQKDIFNEKVIDQLRQYRFAFPNITEGSVAEFQYELEIKGGLEMPDWRFQEQIPVRWSEYKLEIPVWYKFVMVQQGRPLDIQETEKRFGKAVVSKSGGGMENIALFYYHTRLVAKDAPALRAEDYITTMDDYCTRVRFQLQGITFPDGSYEPILSTWDKVAHDLMEYEYFGLQITRKSKYNKVWKAVAPLLPGTATTEEKIAIVYQFVQNAFEQKDNYGIAASKDLDKLFDDKKATAVEMNLLIVALLREAGLKAHPVLISTREHGRPITDYPVVDQFDHLLAAVETGEQMTLLDVGNEFRPPGMVAVNSLNGEGWLVNTDKPRWIPITPVASSELYYGKFALDEEGNLKGKIEIADEGYDAMIRRSVYKEETAPVFWKNTLQKKYSDVSVDSVKLENAAASSLSLRSNFACSIPAYAQVSGDFIYVSPAFYSNYTDSPFKAEHRTCPVDFSYPIKERIVFDLVIPDGYKVESLPESARFSLHENAGRFQYVVKHEGNKISLNSTLSVSELHFELTEYNNLRSFFGMIAEKLGEQIVLKKG